MFRKSKRDLWNELEAVKTAETGFVIHTSVTEITEDMTDADGTLIKSQVPDPDLPDGFELGDQLSTDSSVCIIHELVAE